MNDDSQVTVEPTPEPAADIVTSDIPTPQLYVYPAIELDRVFGGGPTFRITDDDPITDDDRQRR